MKIDQLKGGAALSYVNIFLTNIIGLLITPFIIRSLGSAEYGLYTMIGALVGYMSVLDFGLNNTVIRYVAKYRSQKDSKGEENFLAHSLIMYACISTLIVAIGIVIYSQLELWYQDTLTIEQIQKAKIMMLILIFNLAISLPGGTFRAICSGYEEFILPKVVNIIRYLLRSILVVGLLYLGGDSIGLVILDTIMNIAIIIANAFIVFRKLKVTFKLHQFNIRLFRSILGFSLWIFVFALVHQLRWQAGQMIIGLYYTTSIVAIYAVGITLGNYYGAFSSAIESVFLPRAIQMTVRQESKKSMTEMFIKVSRVILIVLLFIFGGFVLVGRDFIYFWVGPEYMEAYYYVVLMMIGLTPILSQGFANNILEAKNLLSYRGRLLLTLTIVGTILATLMVQEYGVITFIWVTVIFMIMERIIMIPYYTKYANLNMKKYYKSISPLVIYCFILLLVFVPLNQFITEHNVYYFLGKILIYSCFYAFFLKQVTTSFEKDLINKVKMRILTIGLLQHKKKS
ncbi:lipopolysaccharide biosynthesis protein [Muriicola marianensis]|uniref:Teichoic acid transporter n=1 Tax=Muriicola marianensis TaxID=1324801 RepID=A0ABQ1QQE1_9FLAO|nr:oligosaccharide flippase family protein [Muriicola marianensis]GGD40920.1 teichoic acid transporter [Muriicola marianensis]